MSDLSAQDACIAAAAAHHDRAAILWRNTFRHVFTDSVDGGAQWWSTGTTDVQKAESTKAAAIAIYCYLHHRSAKDPALEAERLILLSTFSDVERRTLCEAGKLSTSDLGARAPRKAFGHDLSDPVNDLFAFAWDQQASAGLLAEAFRREEIRRLENKARLMRGGAYSDRDRQSDESWARRNRETFLMAEQREALAQEARAAAQVTDAGRRALAEAEGE